VQKRSVESSKTHTAVCEAPCRRDYVLLRLVAFLKAKVASSILAGGATAKAAKNNENTGRFRRLGWCGTAMRELGMRRTETLRDAEVTRGVVTAW